MAQTIQNIEAEEERQTKRICNQAHRDLRSSMKFITPVVPTNTKQVILTLSLTGCKVLRLSHHTTHSINFEELIKAPGKIPGKSPWLWIHNYVHFLPFYRAQKHHVSEDSAFTVSTLSPTILCNHCPLTVTWMVICIINTEHIGHCWKLYFIKVVG